jgi:hypothetical protein
MVGATRGTPEGFRTDQASGSQQLPPPPPNLAEVMAQQTELLDQLVQAQQNQFRHQQRGRDEPPSTSYQDFFSTQPHFSIRLKSLLMRMHGSALLSPSSRYCPHHAPKQTRHSLQPSSFVALLVFGGIIIMPCSQMDM